MSPVVCRFALVPVFLSLSSCPFNFSFLSCHPLSLFYLLPPLTEFTLVLIETLSLPLSIGMLRIGITGLLLFLAALLWITAPSPWWEGFQSAPASPSSATASSAPVCRKATTPLNDEGGGNAVFLDRHNVQCHPDESLQQFHLVRSGKGQYQYEYTCCTMPSSSSPSSSSPTKEAPHKRQGLEEKVPSIPLFPQSSSSPAPVAYLSTTPLLTQSAPPPVREEIAPENTLTATGATARATGQQSSLLRDIRQLIRNELYAQRATIPVRSES
jgi:hypothetical protein